MSGLEDFQEGARVERALIASFAELEAARIRADGRAHGLLVGALAAKMADELDAFARKVTALLHHPENRRESRR